jgi:hypothetical protein
LKTIKYGSAQAGRGGRLGHDEVEVEGIIARSEDFHGCELRGHYGAAPCKEGGARWSRPAIGLRDVGEEVERSERGVMALKLTRGLDGSAGHCGEDRGVSSEGACGDGTGAE